MAGIQSSKRTRACSRYGATTLRSALVLSCVVASAGLPAQAAAHPSETAAAPPSSSERYAEVRGVGPAKREANGLMRVKLKDGKTLLTHGFDAADARAGRATTTQQGSERQPACASDYYQHVLYAYPADGSNRLTSKTKRTIVSAIKRMNGVLNQDALASGGVSADYKVKCDPTGEVRVDSFQTSQTGAATTFSGVVDAAKAAGFASPNADYTIFLDVSSYACGIGSFSTDQRLSADNYNNTRTGYAVSYRGCWTGLTPMHENGHNQGAVQYDAPSSTGTGGHCNDGNDVMCYSDGGDKDVGMSVFCPDRTYFDCRYDTYFDTAPEPGEYLESHWNLGSPLNRFIAFGAAG